MNPSAQNFSEAAAASQTVSYLPLSLIPSSRSPFPRSPAPHPILPILRMSRAFGYQNAETGSKETGEGP